MDAGSRVGFGRPLRRGRWATGAGVADHCQFVCIDHPKRPSPEDAVSGRGGKRRRTDSYWLWRKLARRS